MAENKHTKRRSDPLEWVKQKAAEVAAKAEQKAAETPRQMFLPGMDEFMRAMPNHIARSSRGRLRKRKIKYVKPLAWPPARLATSRTTPSARQKRHGQRRRCRPTGRSSRQSRRGKRSATAAPAWGVDLSPPRGGSVYLERGGKIVHFFDSQHTNVADGCLKPRMFLAQLLRGQDTLYGVDSICAKVDAALLPSKTQGF